MIQSLKSVLLQVPKTGHLRAQPYREGPWEQVRVQLTKESLQVCRRDVVYEDTIANNVSPQRTKHAAPT